MIGAVLAGGAAGSREVAGRPLAAWPAGALAEVCERVAMVCDRGSELRELPGTVRWEDPLPARHALAAIAHALERARAPVLVCAAHMPFVTPDACRTLLEAAGGAGGPAVVAAAKGELRPLLGLYAPAALATLRDAPADASAASTVEELDPVRVALPPALMRSVATVEELAEAEESLVAATRLR